MSWFNKGDWVRYSGPQEPFREMLGQVTGFAGRFHDESMVTVRFIDGRSYGCYRIFLTKVYQRTAAVEVAKHAMGIGQ